MLAFVQMGRAAVDTAEYTQQMLKIARDQLEVSQQALKGPGHQVSGFASVTSDHEAKTGFKPSDFGAAANGEAHGGGNAAHAELTSPGSPALEGETMKHQGQLITLRNGQYLVGGSSFQTLDLAKKDIDRLIRIENS